MSTITTDRAEWVEEARRFILDREGGPFTANDLWREGLTAPANPMWIGLAIRSLSKEGRIAKTGMTGTDRGNGGLIFRWEVVR